MILHEGPVRTVYDILSVTNCTLLTADNFLCYAKKKLFPIDMSMYTTS